MEKSKNIPEKVLLIGNGYLGKRIAESFRGAASQVKILDFPEVDITNLPSLQAILEQEKPQIVINAAAFTNTNQLELPENQNNGFRINVQGPCNLMIACRSVGAYLVQISTGMIFDGAGIDGKGWKESDKPQPESYYTWTKAWADLALEPFADQGILITRIHLPISRYSDPKNLLEKLGKFESVLDEQHSATMVEDYLKALVALVEKRATGIFHCVNPGTISLYEMRELMKKHGLADKTKPTIAISKADFNAKVATNNGAYQPTPILNTDKLQKLGIMMPNIKEAVEDAIINFK